MDSRFKPFKSLTYVNNSENIHLIKFRKFNSKKKEVGKVFLMVYHHEHFHSSVETFPLTWTFASNHFVPKFQKALNRMLTAFWSVVDISSPGVREKFCFVSEIYAFLLPTSTFFMTLISLVIAFFCGRNSKHYNCWRCNLGSICSISLSSCWTITVLLGKLFKVIEEVDRCWGIGNEDCFLPTSIISMFKDWKLMSLSTNKIFVVLVNGQVVAY